MPNPTQGRKRPAWAEAPDIVGDVIQPAAVGKPHIWIEAAKVASENPSLLGSVGQARPVLTATEVFHLGI